MNYYELLGVASNASTDDIKRAYRKKALELHPDKNIDNQEAADLFRAVTEAYEVLRNAKKRSTYDSLSNDGMPHNSGRAPAWTPSGGDPHFDAWLRRWMRDNGMGPEGQAYMRQKRQQAERTAAMAAQRVSWEEELKEARKQRERDYRMWQRMADRRAARQAAVLRQFWQTHHGVTWQDGVYLSLMSIFTLASAWLIWPKRPLEERHTLSNPRPDVCASSSSGEKS